MSRFHSKSWCVPPDTLLPPPPPGVRYVPVKFMGVIIADDELRISVQRRFHWPMIILALMILPLLAWEFLSPPEAWTFEWWMSLTALTIIWIAFFIEFVVKITIAESRFEYVKRNWLDLIVLALPLLRPLRVAYLARTSRVFALRGVGMKFMRYVVTILIGLEASERLMERVGFKQRKGRRKPEEMTRYQLIDEIKRLRNQNDAWRHWYTEHEQFTTERGLPCYGRVIPSADDLPALDGAVSPGETSDDAAGEAVSGEPDEQIAARPVGDDESPPTIGSSCPSPSPN